jgi:hypothetical protein
MKLLLLLLLLKVVNASSVVVFKVSSTLGSHMVLQRDSDNVVLYGFAQAGSVVNTTIDGKSRFSTVTDVETGIWRQKLPRMEAGGPYSIVFENEGSENITIDDVMFGDVYVLSLSLSTSTPFQCTLINILNQCTGTCAVVSQTCNSR